MRQNLKICLDSISKVASILWFYDLSYFKSGVYTLYTVVEKTNGTGRDLCSKWPILTKL